MIIKNNNNQYFCFFLGFSLLFPSVLRKLQGKTKTNHPNVPTEQSTQRVGDRRRFPVEKLYEQAYKNKKYNFKKAHIIKSIYF